jgi:hypothetical protein
MGGYAVTTVTAGRGVEDRPVGGMSWPAPSANAEPRSTLRLQGRHGPSPGSALTSVRPRAVPMTIAVLPSWAVSLPAMHAHRWHAELDMTIRTGVAIVSLGALAVGCSVAPLPSASRPSAPGPSAPSSATVESSAPAPGVSWLRVSPQEGLRGATVSLDVACLDNLGAVRSPVLEVGALKGDPDGHQPWHLTGTATVRSDAAPGQYPVSANCGTDQLSAAFTVVPHP